LGKKFSPFAAADSFLRKFLILPAAATVEEAQPPQMQEEKVSRDVKNNNKESFSHSHTQHSHL